MYFKLNEINNIIELIGSLNNPIIFFLDWYEDFSFFCIWSSILFFWLFFEIKYQKNFLLSIWLLDLSDTEKYHLCINDTKTISKPFIVFIVISFLSIILSTLFLVEDSCLTLYYVFQDGNIEILDAKGNFSSRFFMIRSSSLLNTTSDVLKLEKAVENFAHLHRVNPFKYTTVRNTYLLDYWAIKQHKVTYQGIFTLDNYLKIVGEQIVRMPKLPHLSYSCWGKLTETHLLGTYLNNTHGFDSIQHISENIQLKTNNRRNLDLGCIANNINFSNGLFIRVSECGNYIRCGEEVWPTIHYKKGTKVIVISPEVKNGLFYNKMYQLEMDELISKSKLTLNYCHSRKNYSISAEISYGNWYKLVKKEHF